MGNVINLLLSFNYMISISIRFCHDDETVTQSAALVRLAVEVVPSKPGNAKIVAFLSEDTFLIGYKYKTTTS